MNKTLIFGHKSPDTDTIMSSLVMANLERKLGNEDVVACRLGDINKETQYALNYFKVDAPELIENVEDVQALSQQITTNLLKVLMELKMPK